MNILDELKLIIIELGKFPTHGDLVKLKFFKLRNAIISSKIKLSEYAEQLGVEAAKPRDYWNEEKILEACKKMCEECNGWPSKEVMNSKYSDIRQACHRNKISMIYFREKLNVKFADPKETSCLQCDKKFTPQGSNWKRQKFCCGECTENFYRIKQNERNAERIKQEKECPICKNKFIPNQTTKQKYCKRSCFIKFRKRLTKALDRTLEYLNTNKMENTSKILGYSGVDLLKHLETFPNFNSIRKQDWHLDHIFPIIAFVNKGITDIKIINCLENLQPLLSDENTTKGDKYDEAIFDVWLENKITLDI